MIDVSRFKVVYKDKVMNALCISAYEAEPYTPEKCEFKMKHIDMIAINEDGNLVYISDEAWMFQFIPIVTKG